MGETLRKEFPLLEFWESIIEEMISEHSKLTRQKLETRYSGEDNA
jgi:hypothetical protein